MIRFIPKLFLPVLTSIVFLASCHSPKTEAGDDRHGLEDSLVVNYYLMGVDGRYDQCVASMQSCDGTTQAYREQVKLALKQRNANVRKLKKGVKEVRVERIIFHDSCSMANAYLNVAFNDGSHEEVQFPLVLSGGTWRMQ